MVDAQDYDTPIQRAIDIDTSGLRGPVPLSFKGCCDQLLLFFRFASPTKSYFSRWGTPVTRL